MKSFKQFVAESHQPEVQQGIVGPNGIPSAVILNDRSHLPETPVNPAEVEQGKVVNGIPAAVVLNTRPVKEDIDEDSIDVAHEHNSNWHLGATVEEAHRHMHTMQEHSPESLKHITKYTQHSSNLNKALYDAHVEGKPAPKKVDHLHSNIEPHDIAKLDKAVTHHELKDDLHVFSGTHFHPGKVSSMHKDGLIHLPAYTSTSIDKQVATGFAHSASFTRPELRDGTHMGHMIHFHLKAGQNGAYVGEHSAFSHEKEFILPRNTTIKVHPHPTTHETVDGQKYHMWHAEVV